ncbi:CoA-binding protein [Thalassoroseus pseudoceratinae]|uniref:CoA-binding protein n=1 Tax=Thalassoroseus pseudoceratinae TaxID=2713176 RepID=UPI001F1112BF|nr:CoA-binding protein [Thalassoroseus pseudoceratinae]
MSEKTVAILGASRQRHKFGNKAVRAHQSEGYAVYPVNPSAEEIEGLPCYKTLADIPVERLNRVSVYLPPEVVLELLPQIAEVHPAELWLNPGSESDEVVAEAEQLGLTVIQACSIVSLGRMPTQFANE